MFLKKFMRFVANFFITDSKESMMRLISLILVISGICIVYTAVLLKLDGAHYGLELAVLGVIGKSYQKGKEIEQNK